MMLQGVLIGKFVEENVVANKTLANKFGSAVQRKKQLSWRQAVYAGNAE